MNIRHENNRHDDDSFDAAMRDLHARALTQVSPQTRNRLRAARAAAAQRAPRGLGWMLASGFAAVFALAIGLQWQGPSRVSPPTQVADADAIDDVIDGMDTAVATMDENPDFYLWLASNDDTLPGALER